MTRALEVSLAGRVSISGDRVLIDEERFPGRQGRLVFAYLVSEQGRPVPRDELAEALWGETLPATWEKALTVIVSKLRALLGECRLDGAKVLTNAFGCYRLELPEGTSVDLITAARAAEQAEAALAVDEPDRARAEASRAESLARLPLLPGEDGAWLEGKRRELADVRARALDCLAGAALRSGDASEAARWAEEAIALEPFRDSGYRHLMHAHAVAGNRAEALRAYERCRRLLAEELGAYPSPETESIYRELLARGVAVTTPEEAARDEPPEPSPLLPLPDDEPPRPRHRLMLLFGALALAAAALGAILLARSGESVPAIVPNSVVKINPETNEVSGVYRVGRDPIFLASVGDWVFATNLGDRTLSRIDARSGGVRTVGTLGSPFALAGAPDGTLWIGSDAVGEVTQLNPPSLAVLRRVRLGRQATAFVAAGGGSLWVSQGFPALAVESSVLRINLRSGSVARTFPIPPVGTPVDLAFGEGAAWVAVGFKSLLLRIDAVEGTVRTIPIVPWPSNPAVAFHDVWVASSDGDRVYRVDALTMGVEDIIPVGDGPFAVAAGAGAVWVANEGAGTVSRIDPRTNQVVATIQTGHHPHGIAVAGGSVWVSISSKVFSTTGTGLVPGA